MALEDVRKKIDNYLKKDDVGPMIVNAQNKEDLDDIVTHYQLPTNTFIYASDKEFCNYDELPRIDALIDRLQREDKVFFVREISTFYSLMGKTELANVLREFLSLNVAGHAIFVTYQCADELKKIMMNDTRLSNRIYLLEGEITPRPKLVFTLAGINFDEKVQCVDGVNCIARAIESELSDTIYIETSKTKDSYPYSMYMISELKHPYEVLCQKDNLTSQLDREIGYEDDWQYVLSEFNTYPSWNLLISAKIGNTQNLDVAITGYPNSKSNKHWFWLYFIGVKLFGAGTDPYLNKAVKNANSTADFVRNIYRCILDINPHSADFTTIYDRRKVLLNAIENPIDQLIDFCNIVISKGRNAFYYLTDNTIKEKELVFELLDKYGLEYDRNELMEILKKVYPDLWNYLSKYHFKNKLLDDYFQDYKYQKVINTILPEFMDIVKQQAVDRDYNSILPARSSITEGIDRTGAQTYFTDAMGVEYLAFILSRCREYSLMAKVTVCRCELPSITCFNKEFWDLFSSEDSPIITIRDIDEIKHHGKYNYDYEKTKTPIHLIKEMEIIDNLLRNKIWPDLKQEKYDKAILISDHGASRLAVIHDTEILWEMENNGDHSGRCCPKSEVDEKPKSAVDAGDFWALANYDRFKGSRKANVEVHGGATLEEVTVPIIEITYLHGEVEVRLMPVDEPATYEGIPEITISYKEPASIKIYISQKMEDVSIEVDGHNYDALKVDDYYYVVDSMPEINKAKLYNVDVYSHGNKIASELPLRIKKASGSEKSLF